MVAQKPVINYVWGDEMSSKRLIQDYRMFDKEKFIFSIFKLYNFSRNYEKLERIGIHEYANHSGNIILDSGGFQLISKDLDINYQDTLKIYDAASLKKGDFGIALDYCPRADESPGIRMDKIKRSNENFKKMNDANKKVLHVIHGWSKKEIDLSFKGLINREVLTFGSCFAMIAMNIALDELLGGGSIKDILIKRFMIFQEILKQKRLDETKKKNDFEKDFYYGLS